MSRSANDYMDVALIPFLQRELPKGTEVVPESVTETHVTVTVRVPHKFTRIEPLQSRSENPAR